jgi:squalene synthase HpnC
LLAEQAPPAQTLAQAYAHCRRIALGHYENFPVVSWLLPRELRPHIFAIYAYCRGVDDLGDEAKGDRPALLDGWEAELRSCYDGSPNDARFVALADTIRRFEIPPEPFLRLIEANRRDQRVSRYQTFNELVDYCSHSANPVGRLVLYVFGYRDEERARLADATCTALQLANFWQDVRRDLKMGRIYIPLEDMARFGFSEADLAARKVTPEFRRLMRFEVARTREYFARGLPLVDLVAGRLRLDLRMFTLGGLAVLDQIEWQRFDVLTRRPRVSGVRKAWLLVRGLAPVRVRVEEAR